MKYRNIKTGFVFDSPCKIRGEGWEILDPRPTLKKENQEKPVKAKKEKKDE